MTLSDIIKPEKTSGKYEIIEFHSIFSKHVWTCTIQISLCWHKHIDRSGNSYVEGINFLGSQLFTSVRLSKIIALLRPHQVITFEADVLGKSSNFPTSVVSCFVLHKGEFNF